jgi:hypothetical protein
MPLFPETPDPEETMSENTRPCEICQTPIDPERLEVLPETRLCTEHARKINKFGGEFTVTITQEKTSKQGSLKKNYGGVSPHKSRNSDAMEKLRSEYRTEQEGK